MEKQTGGLEKYFENNFFLITFNYYWRLSTSLLLGHPYSSSSDDTVHVKKPVSDVSSDISETDMNDEEESSPQDLSLVHNN